MLSLRAHLFIFLGILGLLILLPAAAGVLQATTGMTEAPPAWRLPGMILVFGLFLALGFSAVPVIVKSVLVFQKAVGNQDKAAIRAVVARQNLIIWVMWGLMAGGSLLAIPAAIAGGMFGTGPARAVLGGGPGKTEGLLVARPGMTVAEMARLSTLKLETNARDGHPYPVVAGGATFDFQVPGSAVVFKDCRYYFVSTFSKDPTRIEGMSIGTASRKMTRAELNAADADVRARLAADGWLTGHEVYRTEEDRTLHGGRTEGPEGHVWLKDGTVLSLAARRMDEETPGEDASTAGEWIQFIELWSRDGYSGIERYVFAPYRAVATRAEASR